MHCWVLLSLESLSASICSLNTLFIEILSALLVFKHAGRSSELFENPRILSNESRKKKKKVEAILNWTEKKTVAFIEIRVNAGRNGEAPENDLERRRLSESR